MDIKKQDSPKKPESPKKISGEATVEPLSQEAEVEAILHLYNCLAALNKCPDIRHTAKRFSSNL